MQTKVDLTRRLSVEEINACPMQSWEGPVVVVRSRPELDDAVRQLAGEELLGFDTETRPAYRKGESYPPALLQLAGEQTVFLFHLSRLGLPEPLLSILADSKIIKAGVSLEYDLRQLTDLAPFRPAGFVDLGRTARQSGIKNHGLRGLAALLLGYRIGKGAQTSNWAKEPLSPGQIRYAATDAWVGRELYVKMQDLMLLG